MAEKTTSTLDSDFVPTEKDAYEMSVRAKEKMLKGEETANDELYRQGMEEFTKLRGRKDALIQAAYTALILGDKLRAVQALTTAKQEFGGDPDVLYAQEDILNHVKEKKGVF